MMISQADSSRRISAATIKVRPAKPIDPLADLRRLIVEAENQNEAAILAISACISDGTDTKSAIIGTLMQLGFKNGHAAIQLDKNAGPHPHRHRWCLDQVTRRYSLHP